MNLFGLSFVLFIEKYLTLSVPEKLKNSIFDMSIIPQTLNINNLRTISEKSINLYPIRKLIKYSLKNVRLKAIFTLTVFEILLFKRTLVLSPAQSVRGSERVKVSVKSQKNIRILWKLLEK